MLKSLSSLHVEGYDLLPIFNQYNPVYSLTVPHDVDSVNVLYTLGPDAKKAVVEGNTDLVEGDNTVTVTVTNCDDSTTVYTIGVTRDINYANCIRAMHMVGLAEGQSMSYTALVEKGKTYTFTLLWKCLGEKVPFFGLSVGGTGKTLIVGNTAQTGVNYDPATGKLSYTFTAEGIFLALCASFTTTGWSKYEEIYFAKPELYESDSEGNRIGGFVDCNADFDPRWSTYMCALNRVELVPEKFFNGTQYHSLSNIVLNGQPLHPAFNVCLTDYMVVLPQEDGKMEIGYTLGEDGINAVVVGDGEIEAGQTKTVTVAVTNKDGSVTDYTVTVYRESVPHPQLLSLELGHKLRPSFSPSVTHYTITVPYETEQLDVAYELSEAAALKSITGNGNFEVGIPSEVAITLENDMGVQNAYTIAVTRKASKTGMPVQQKKEKGTATQTVESTSHSTLLVYLMGARPTYMSKDMFASCVGYYPDGDMTKAPTDTMFDSFALMSSNGYQHDRFSTAGIAVLDKDRLEEYYDCEFKNEVNLDALNSAVGDLKKALNKPDYKVNVFLPYYIAQPDGRYFGEVNGKNLDLWVEEDRLAVMEWQIDEQVRRFEEKGYEHIQILGFHMVVENVFVGGDAFKDIVSREIRHFNAYAASNGYEVMIAPFNSLGTHYDKWKDMGYTRCTMQINHFPRTFDPETGKIGNQQNSKGIEVFKEATKLVAKYGIGLCLEWSCMGQGVIRPNTECDGTMYFKRYMDYGIKYGYMYCPCLSYQLDGGPNSVYDIATHESSYVRSTYDELYRFIKCALDEEDIRWYEDFQ